MAARTSSGRPKMPTSVHGGRYKIEEKLGSGCFGEVYRGSESKEGTEVAMKLEDLQARTQQLEMEAQVMNELRAPVQPQGFSECFAYGREGRFFYLVMELLGKSLEDCVSTCKGKLSPLTTALIAEQLMARLEYLHSKGIIHRDIKPENFMCGVKNKIHHLYMIDFGLSKRYFDKVHIPHRNKLSLTGTARYASVNAHRGLEQSRRDDLEAVGHMLMYFLRGVLPWSGLDAKTKEEKYNKIRQYKENTRLSDLCSGYPPEFEQYLGICRSLDFTERPKYKELRALFTDVRQRLGPGCRDHALEWLKEKKVDESALVPLTPWTHPPPQPDDDVKVEPPVKAGAVTRGSGGFFCCFGAPRRPAPVPEQAPQPSRAAP
uniref:Casein kinase I n=1 Tax=Zooxanthella nutricula TaxID=1333877 RepID=A0A7S2L8P8_9DINO|mmetsp:Transcript_58098/g.177023  ORF Transcript_58098/g.177023 Transcript_58098/m.177023 type:complete len:375 (+) Transcript_58098:2-1126(+)